MITNKLRSLLLGVLCVMAPIANASEFFINVADLAFVNSEISLQVTVPADEKYGDIRLLIADEVYVPSSFADGQLGFDPIKLSSMGTYSITLLRGSAQLSEKSIRVIPGWFTLVPPALAIIIALVFHSVIPALFMGLLVGIWGIVGFTPSGFLIALMKSFETYIKNALIDPDQATVILFTLMTSGMVGILARNGGLSGMVQTLIKWTDTPRRGMLSSAGLGIVIFFDDYATALLVGKTMRPITDRLKISREKLAYIVDTTAAPLACIAFLTTWVGFQMSLIGNSIADIPDLNLTASSILIASISYSFYPILALVFVIMVSISGRDFGPMYRAEKLAREQGVGENVQTSNTQTKNSTEPSDQRNSEKTVPSRALNFFIPIMVLTATLLGGLIYTGEGDSLSEIVGSADAFKVLMWASFAGAATAGVITLLQGILSLEETVQAWYSGVQTMLYSMIILLLAWSLSAITGELHTADFVVSIIGESITPALIPSVIFVFSALIAFATGSSFSTMGIMIPLVLPLVWGLLQVNGQADPEHYFIVYSSVSSVMAGAVWGDHCSPISDTTILSSMSSDCDHIEHVKTQLPYAMSVSMVAIVFGIIPSGFGMPLWFCMLISIAALWAILRILGKKTENEKVQWSENLSPAY